jgi:hypothetical protein
MLSQIWRYAQHIGGVPTRRLGYLICPQPKGPVPNGAKIRRLWDNLLPNGFCSRAVHRPERADIPEPRVERSANRGKGPKNVVALQGRKIACVDAHLSLVETNTVAFAEGDTFAEGDRSDTFAEGDRSDKGES